MPKEVYDPGNPKYRCCCGCHVTTGAMIICLLYFLSDLLIMLQRIFLNSDEPIFIGFAVAFAALGVMAFGIGFLSTKNEKPKLLIPALIIIACIIIYAIVDGLYGIYTFLTTQTPRMIFFENINKRKLIWPYDDSEPKQPALIIVALVVRTLIGVAFHSWLFSILYRCYQYLTAKNDAVRERPSIYHSTNVNVV